MNDRAWEGCTTRGTKTKVVRRSIWETGLGPFGLFLGSFPPTRHKYEADNEGRKEKRPATPFLDSGPVSAGSPVRGGVAGEG